jgi:hypothetical protein
LVVGDLADLTTTYCMWTARRLGVEVIECPESQLGETWDFWADGRGSGGLSAGGRELGFPQISGAIVRFSPVPEAPSLGLTDVSEAVLIAERRAGIEQFLDTAPFPVANRPSSGRSNGSKPLQMRLLASLGLRVPGWVVTNERHIAEEFMGMLGSGAIYKSVSGLRSHVRRADQEFIERIGDLTPVVLQEYVDGCDVRVHVVGERCFGTKVASAEIDYRFDDTGARFSEAPVPEEIQRLSRKAAAAEQLTLAGLDFRVTPTGEWFCLEMNPVPTFLPYEAETGAPIAEALVRRLTNDHGRP